MARLYSQSWGQADAARRADLLTTRGDCLSRRDACRTSDCIADAYLTRMQEINRIMQRRGNSE